MVDGCGGALVMVTIGYLGLRRGRRAPDDPTDRPRVTGAMARESASAVKVANSVSRHS